MVTAHANERLPWWQTGVVYQVYPRSFQDSNGDGVGDLPGITARLDHLVSLGVDALWISPFYPSPMKDFGYDVADYCGVDPLFGALDDFDRLLAAAHGRGLKVIVDWVPNHSSDQHPWFQASRRSRTDPHRDWYVWRDPAPGGGPPNNWAATFGGPAWTFDPATRQYYLHLFLPEQPDLNWRNPELRRAMLDTLRFWLDRGVDGFRIDVAHRILKDPALRDNPPNPGTARGFHKSLGAYDAQLHVHDGAHADAHDVYREIRRLVDGHDPRRARVAIGEIHVYDPLALAAWYGAGLDELHLPFNFTLLATPWTAAAIRGAVDAMEAALPAGAWPNWVLGNHDESRVATRLGTAQARAAMVLLLTLRGTPTIYQGDELGMEDVPVPPDRVQDPFGRRVPGLGLGRDPERSPMLWDGTANAGFAAPGVTPWLPLAEDAARRSVSAQAGDPGSMLSLTRGLLRLRRERAALHRGSYRPVEGVPPDVFAFVREDGLDRVLVAVHFAAGAVRLDLPERARAVLASTHPGAAPSAPTELALRGHEAVVVELAGAR
jgi:glycosidase